MVFLLGALCYTVCTMKAHPGAFMGFTISWHLRKPPLQDLERRLHGVPVQCSVLYNMHHEGSSPDPSRAWGGDFITFIFFVSVLLIKPNLQLAKVLGNSHATHGSCLALINCIVADHSEL